VRKRGPSRLRPIHTAYVGASSVILGYLRETRNKTVYNDLPVKSAHLRAARRRPVEIGRNTKREASEKPGKGWIPVWGGESAQDFCETISERGRERRTEGLPKERRPQ